MIAINGSGRAPLEISADWLLEQNVDKIQQQSAHAVTVPTAVDAWIQLNRDHGNMPLDQLLKPAIGYAKDGFPVGQRSACDFAGCLELLQGDKDAADVFLKDGQTYQMGELLRQPNLAKTLTAIAEQGRDGFYKGWVAQDMLAKLTALGGRHSQADLDAPLPPMFSPSKASSEAMMFGNARQMVRA